MREIRKDNHSGTFLVLKPCMKSREVEKIVQYHGQSGRLSLGRINGKKGEYVAHPHPLRALIFAEDC